MTILRTVMDEHSDCAGRRRDRGHAQRRHHGSDFEKAMIAGTPLGRIGQPDDIARVALFLASDDSAWLTGERLMASGGYR
jgi:NAD(P)-dependent dehydrogenase (short-subunit alcohol dehydrogenase family)